MNSIVRSAFVVVALVVAAASASAQGMFYAEETKDGPDLRLQHQGQLGRLQGVRRDGHGTHPARRRPERRDGLRRQRDGARAVLLQARHHGEVVDRPKPPVQRIEWRDGKTRFTVGNNFYMEMSNRIQLRYTFQQPDDSITLPGTGGAGRQQGQLPHPARQVQARGLVLQAEPRVRAPAQLDGRGQRAREPDARGRQHRLGHLEEEGRSASKFGQFKAPFGRQQLTSSGAQQFVDRAIIDGRFNDARARPASHSGALSARTSSTGAS